MTFAGGQLVKPGTLTNMLIWSCALLAGVSCSEDDRKEALDQRTLNTFKSDSVGMVVGKLISPDATSKHLINGATVHLVGNQSYTTRTNSDGVYSLSEVKVGSYNLYATTKPSLNLASPSTYGVWVQNIEVKPKQSIQVNDQVVAPTATLQGKVQTFLDKGANFAKASVKLLELQQTVRPKQDGEFTFSNLPEGRYTLEVTLDNYKSAVIKDIFLGAGTLKVIEEIVLSKDDRPAARFVPDFHEVATMGEQKIPLSLSRIAKFKIESDFAATFLRVSESRTFDNTPYKKLNEALSWKFSGEGKQTLFGQVKSETGVESKVFSIDIVVDTQAPAIASLQINDGFASTNSSINIVRIEASDSGSGIEKVYLSRDESFADVQEFTMDDMPVRWDFQQTGATLKVYARVRDYAGRDSSIAMASIDWSSNSLSTVGKGTFSNPVKFIRDASPYFITGNTSFAGDVYIEAGVEVSIASGAKVDFQGQVTMAGTDELGIHIKTDSAHTDSLSGNCSNLIAAKLDFSSSPHVTANYTTFTFLADQNGQQNQFGIKVNAGNFFHSTFNMSQCTDQVYGVIHKLGTGKLSITHSRFRNWDVAVELNGGDVTFSANFGDVAACLSDVSAGAGTFNEFENYDFDTDMQGNPPEGCQGLPL